MSCHSFTTFVALALFSLVGGCGGDQVSLGNPPVETVTPFDWNYAYALVRGGNVLYAPRLTRIDAIDAQGVSKVAGFDYRACPTNGRDFHWGPRPYDAEYLSFVVDGDTAILAHRLCGVWSVSFKDSTKRAMLERRIEDDGWDNRWGTQMGPAWSWSSPPVLAFDGDEPVLCLTINRGRERVAREESGALPDLTTLDRVELWRIARDGSPRGKLAEFGPREEHCTHVLRDDAALFIATEHAIHRLDRASASPTVIATDAGASFGSIDGRGLDGLVQDADHLYLLRRSVIERVAKDGSSRTVLVPFPSTRFVRTGIATDGEHVYWVEGRALYRVPVTGGTPEKLVDGTEERGVSPMPPVITADHVWFQLVQEVSPHSVTDPETGVTLDDIELQFAIARVAR